MRSDVQQVIYSQGELNNNNVISEICIKLIEEYSRLEKQQYIVANDILESIFIKEDNWKIEHIQKQWRGKKKDFGSWYLNLDVRNRIAFINYFGIFGFDDNSYLASIKNNPTAALFLDTPMIYTAFKKIIIFFNSHGISLKPTQWLELVNIPTFKGKSFDENDPCYGNSAHWGNYILSLPEEEKSRVIGLVIKNYEG